MLKHRVSTWVAAAFVLAIVAVSLVSLNKRTPVVHRPIPRLAGFVPSASFFCVRYNRNIVHSLYYYEASLVGYHNPIDDIDYMVPPSYHSPVCTPGDKRDHYTFFGIVPVDGSGNVQLWGTPNGGRFAFAHMYVTNTVSSIPLATSIPIVPLEIPSKCNRKPAQCNFAVGDSNTAKVVAAALLMMKTHVVPTARDYIGGTNVGLSGWPSSYQFSNGSCYDFYSCEIDAHLCLILDQLADNYFYYISYRAPIPKPKFPINTWNRHAVTHHYRHKIPAFFHHRLGTIPAHWWHKVKKRCQSVVSNQVYYKKYKFIKQQFEKCSLLYWPHGNKFKTTRR
jgi:hypothetical protein